MNRYFFNSLSDSKDLYLLNVPISIDHWSQLPSFLRNLTRPKKKKEAALKTWIIQIVRIFLPQTKIGKNNERKENEENSVPKTATGWRGTMPTGAVTAKSERRFSENNLRSRKKSWRTVHGGGGRAAAIKKSRVSIHTPSGRGDFSKYKFRVTHTICPSVSPPRRESPPLKQPALRRRPSFFFFFHIINSLRRTATGLCALFDPSCHPRSPVDAEQLPRNTLPRLCTESECKRWSCAGLMLVIRNFSVNRRCDSQWEVSKGDNWSWNYSKF